MNSTIKTIFLLGLLSVLVITLGGFLGGQDGLISAFFFSLIMNFSAYFFSDKLALMSSGAKAVSLNQYPQIHQMLKNLSAKMAIPQPKLYLIPESQLNAFATGRDPAHASVALTQGLISSLPSDQLASVIAHELAHIKNRDILLASVAAVLASTISFLGNMALWGRGHQDEDNQSAAGLGILAAILMPIGASIVQMAISREREFAADAMSARTLGSGQPLAQALMSIHRSVSVRPMNLNPAYASLYITNPLGGVGANLLKLFSTHPPVEDRIRRLVQQTVIS